MRILLAVSLTTLLAACASAPQTPAAPAAPAAKADVPAAAPQCYNGDDGKFYPAGNTAQIAGVNVICKASGDGKSATWHGAK